MKISYFAAIIAVSLSSSLFAFETHCPEGSMMDVNNPTVCIKKPNCSPCPDGWYYKHPKKDLDYKEAACVQCASGYTWDSVNKKCAELMH